MPKSQQQKPMQDDRAMEAGHSRGAGPPTDDRDRDEGGTQGQQLPAKAPITHRHDNKGGLSAASRR